MKPGSLTTLLQYAMFALGVAIVLVALCGCGEVRHPAGPAPEPTVADQLRDIGSVFLTWGGLSLGLGVVFRIVVFAASVIATGPVGVILGTAARWVGPFIGLAAIGGLASLVTGAAFTWLADYLWAVVLACVVTAVACTVYYWPRIRAWLPAREAPRSQPE